MNEGFICQSVCMMALLVACLGRTVCKVYIVYDELVWQQFDGHEVFAELQLVNASILERSRPLEHLPYASLYRLNLLCLREPRRFGNETWLFCLLAPEIAPRLV